MARAYSLYLRNRVLNEILLGKKHEEIARTFKIGVATLRRWIKLYKEKADLHPKKLAKTILRKVDYSKIEVYINENSDKAFKEIGVKFGISAFAVCKIFKKLDFTYKKTISLRRKNEVLRSEYKQKIQRIPR